MKEKGQTKSKIIHIIFKSSMGLIIVIVFSFSLNDLSNKNFSHISAHKKLLYALFCLLLSEVYGRGSLSVCLRKNSLDEKVY